MDVIVVARAEAAQKVQRLTGPESRYRVFEEPKAAMAYADAHSYDLMLMDTRLCQPLSDALGDWFETRVPRRPVLMVDMEEQSTDVWMLQPMGRQAPQPSPEVQQDPVLLYVQCFGNFEVFQRDRTRLNFKRKKSKELFAYLILRRGAACSNGELAAVLFEDDCYDTKRQQYLQKIIASLRETLDEVGAGAVLVRSYGNISVDVNRVQCDYYQFTHNDMDILRSWSGEFMQQYSWAEPMAGYIASVSG